MGRSVHLRSAGSGLRLGWIRRRALALPTHQDLARALHEDEDDETLAAMRVRLRSWELDGVVPQPKHLGLVSTRLAQRLEIAPASADHVAFARWLVHGGDAPACVSRFAVTEASKHELQIATTADAVEPSAEVLASFEDAAARLVLELEQVAETPQQRALAQRLRSFFQENDMHDAVNKRKWMLLLKKAQRLPA